MLKGITFGSLFIFLLLIANQINASVTCEGPYKGKRLTPSQLNAILNAKKTMNLCGANLQDYDLSHRDLNQINLSFSNLGNVNFSGTNLEEANLYQAYFREADLTQANLKGADLHNTNFEYAHLQHADLRRAQLQHANLKYANLNQAQLNFADLSHADLSNANLTGANFHWAQLNETDLTSTEAAQTNFIQAHLVKADFTQSQLQNANFSNANLRGANFTQANLEQANFTHTNLKGVIYEPRLGHLPNLMSLTRSRHFRQLQIDSEHAVAALAELRAAYQRIGILAMERQITAMINVYQMRQDWRSGGWGYLEAAFSYLLFYLTSDYGASPGRPLIIFLVLIILFTLPYRITLGAPSRKAGILVQWYPHRFQAWHKVQTLEDTKQLQMMLHRRRPTTWRAMLHEEWRVWRIAFFFSILSAFSIGWRDLNIRNWIYRLQFREYTLSGKGWVRFAAGIQPIISAYLIVLWVLTYFGRPFAW